MKRSLLASVLVLALGCDKEGKLSAARQKCAARLKIAQDQFDEIVKRPGVSATAIAAAQDQLRMKAATCSEMKRDCERGFYSIECQAALNANAP